MRTDKGPGVSLTNYEVKFRDAELVRLYNLDWQMRIHLAVNDPFPAERTNACIGDAVSDGGYLPFHHFDPLQDVEKLELEKMSSNDLKILEEETVKKNVWYCCQEVCQRIDDAPAPYGYMSAHVSPRPESQFFYNTKYLLQYHTAESKVESVPGHTYFEKVEQFMECHYKEGENFREFIKFSCIKESGCSSCTEWVGSVITACPRPVPNSVYHPDYHYLSYTKTPTKDREIDDFQPRKQLKIAFAENKVSTSDEESVSTFADQYAVKPKLVLEYLQHIETKRFRKEKRRQEQLKEKTMATDKLFSDYKWNDLTKNENKLKKLRVKELNKYLVHHHLVQHIKKKMKSEKIIAILQHWHSSSDKHERDQLGAKQAAQLADEGEEIADDDKDDEEYDSTDDEEQQDDDDDIVLSVIGDDANYPCQETGGSVSRSGRRISQRNQSDFFYF